MAQQFSNPQTEFDPAGASDAKRNLLQKYLRGEMSQALGSPSAISRRRPEEPPQLSFAQERLWFLDQLMPGTPVFNVPIALRLSGPIDFAALKRSVNEIVRRHEVFRTTFVAFEGRPMSKISPDRYHELQFLDLSRMPPAERAAESQKLVEAEALQSFDLARGPLIRTSLIKLDEQQSMFLLTMHHIISDGWSILLFFQELSTIYQAFMEGKPSPLGAPPIQYSDYAAWQKEWLRGEVLDRQLKYWKNKLSGDLPTLALPADKPHPPVQTYSGARLTLNLSAELTQALVALSLREGATLFMTLLAAFKLLLQRYTGQEDIIVGSPIANRPQAETEKLIGYFLNNLALRTDLSGDPGFRDLISRVRNTALDAYAHQDVPFEKLIEELKPERDLSRTPIFQVYFNLFSFSDPLELPDGKKLSFVDAWLQSEEHLSKFDLTLYAGLQNEELKLAFVYNTDLFEASTMSQMLAHFRNLLAAVANNPNLEISQYTFGDNSEIECRDERIQPQNDFPKFEKSEIEQSIYERFASQVQKYPARIAVKSTNHSWTYAELDARATHIARSVASMCGNAEERAALLCDHDAPMIAAMLGALRAGKTYVPLDPNYPEARLRYILGHSESTAILADEKNFARALQLAPAGVQVINIDRPQSFVPQIDLSDVAPETPAYILYTSGSTGRPKGVVQNHRNVLHFIRVYTNNLHIEPADRLTLLSSYCFDAAVMDIYGALLNGATLYPIDVRRRGLGDLSACLAAEKITIYHSTPTVYQYFVETLSGHNNLPDLRLIVLGGERVSRRDVESYRKLFSDHCLLVNGLGPTESTVSLQNFIDQRSALSGESVSVGFPVAETEVLLLSNSGKPVEIQGEIAIKSRYIALGYWRDDAATEAAFISSADKNDDTRIYKTGDLGRRLADGSIRFEGRRDFQVKIRGFRVETGEVEAVLCQHSLVRDSVVIAREVESRGTQLIAYVVPQTNLAPNERDLREFLQNHLPEYMVPTEWVMLDALPMTESGKVNRRALPDPIRRNPASVPSAAAETETEKRLLPIWSEVLGVSVGVNDNFFECGGHSLLAVRLFAQIEKRLGHHLPLATLFQAPTVAQLASTIEADSSRSWTSLVPIQTGGSNPPFFCVHGLGGHVIEFYDLARHLGPNQPFYGLQSQGLDGKHPLHTSIPEMARHYLKEMRELQPSGPYFIGGRSLGGTIAFEMACQLRAQGLEVGLLALLDTYPAGYAKLLPAVSQPETNFGRVANRIESHFRNLRRLSFAEKVSYLIEKMRYAPRKVKSFLWRRAYRRYRNHDQQAPRLLRDIAEYNSMAGHEYEPQVYDGRVILFWASGDLRAYDLVEGWRVLVPRGIEVQEISGTHLNMIKEPHVAELALKLTEAVARSQGRHLRMTEPEKGALSPQATPVYVADSAPVRKAS